MRGRPIHAKQALIPTKHVGMNGFECIVPLVMSEKEDGSDQHGVMLSLGFIPQEYAHPSMRYKVESSDWQTFTAYVSTLDELQAHGTFTNGNKGGFENVGEGCWNYADLEHIAKQSGLTNWKSSKHAILEQVNPNTEKDERSRVRRDHDSSFQQDLPYA